MKGSMIPWQNRKDILRVNLIDGMRESQRRSSGSVDRAGVVWRGARLMKWIEFISLLFVAVAVANQLKSTHHPEEIAAAEKSMTPMTEVTFRTVGKGNRSGVREFQQKVARSQSEWETLWQRHTAAETSPPAPPVVDFNKEIAIAIFLGEKPTGGHAVEIVRVDRKDGELVINYKELNPAPGGMVTQAFTQPFHMVRVAKNGEQKITFRRDS